MRAIVLEPDEMAAVRTVVAMLEQFTPGRSRPGACTAVLIYAGPDGGAAEIVLDFMDGRRERYPVAEDMALSGARQYRLGPRAEMDDDGRVD